MSYTKVNSKIGAIMIETTDEGFLTYKGIREFLSERPDIKLTTICDAYCVYRATISSPMLKGFPTEEMGEAETSTEAYHLAIIKAVREAYGIEALVPGEEVPETLIMKTQAEAAISEESKKTDKITPTKEATSEKEPTCEAKEISVNTVDKKDESLEEQKPSVDETIIDCAGATKTHPTTVADLVSNNFGLARWIAHTHSKSTDEKKRSQAEAIIAYCEKNKISLE